MFKCLICLKEKPDNEETYEHIIPSHLGSNIILKRVCRDCNGLLGSVVDPEAMKDVTFLFTRVLSGALTRSDTLPQIDLEDSVMLSDEGETPVIPTFTKDGPSLRVKPHIQKTANGKVKVVIDPKDNTPDRLKEIAVELGLDPDSLLRAHTTRCNS